MKLWISFICDSNIIFSGLYIRNVCVHDPFGAVIDEHYPRPDGHHVDIFLDDARRAFFCFSPMDFYEFSPASKTNMLLRHIPFAVCFYLALFT